jgi:acyl-coenzyme A synthetase/AMP-(fatty) acid ligase
MRSVIVWQSRPALAVPTFAAVVSVHSFLFSFAFISYIVVFAIPSHPVYAGEIQGKVLGMAVEIFDEAGKDISASGMAGELVCTRPHPSIPLRFWGDDSRGTRFLKAYYDTYPGVWHHGDFVAMNPRTRGYIIFGRRSEYHINSVP